MPQRDAKLKKTLSLYVYYYLLCTYCYIICAFFDNWFISVICINSGYALPKISLLSAQPLSTSSVLYHYSKCDFFSYFLVEYVCNIKVIFVV